MNDSSAGLPEEPGSVAVPILKDKDRRRDSLLRIKTVKARTGLSIATIYRRESKGSFPKRTQIGLGCVGWYESDIEDFVADPLNYRRP
ncbi:AlpA family transcriptional regulator [Altererythrobacter sp. B11]|uniref:helix-turn-helix transcriptional regulator n=1 Tax=Altererythrobacter sp. B11 TaxID=2060312 RepID=UPI000DC71BDA|nr:AlpA family phage regulatory protein [Altererythrobacter sp. B11]BBC73310.1 AlpA family transcriptional regulator [Altererythrobacter sp. B11]